MRERRWMGLLAINLAVLIATSPPYDSVEDSAAPLDVALSAESPALYVEGTIRAMEAVDELNLSLSFEGTNFASQTGVLSIYRLSQDELLPAVDAAPDSTATVDARAGQELEVTFFGSTPAERGPFRLYLELEGGADFEGQLTATVRGSVHVKEDDPWIALEDVSAVGVAP